MSDIFQYICAHADHAHYIFLGLLFLAGLNLPISEDLLLLTAGALVSRCIPDQYWHLYSWMFIGCWLSGWEPYWLGRLLGPKLYKIRWFQHIINPERIQHLHYYYEKFGIWTFILGRLIPGGVRNALFITSGMGKMPFLLFTSRDFVAAFVSTNIVFYIGFLFGENYELLADYVIRYNRIAFFILALLVLGTCLRIWKKNKKYSHDDLP
jgi:membrane-associated protein